MAPHPSIDLLKMFSFISAASYFSDYKGVKIHMWRCLGVKENICLGQNMSPQNTVVS